MDHLSKSKKQNYEVGLRGSVLNKLGATQMNDSKDYGFDWINNHTYDWDSSRREEFNMSKRETTKGWNAYGATLLDGDGRPIRDNVGRTVRENLGASRRVDLGTTGETRLEVTPDFTGTENYGGRHHEKYYHPDSPGPSVSVTDEPLPPVTERVLYPSTEPYEYAVDDGFETADGKQRRWTSVAADRSLMRQWHDMFGRIRTKWSSNSEFDSLHGVSRMSRDQSFSDKEDDDDKRPRLQRLAFIGGAVCIVLLVAVLVPVILLTGRKDKQTKEVFLKYDYEATVTNRNYSEDMANTSSEAFTTVENEFCDQLDRNAENKTNEEFIYQGCAVTEIRQGSLVISYTLVISSVITPTADQVSNFVGITVSGNQQDIGNFTISLTVVVTAAVVISEDNSPVRKKVQFNATCSISNHDRCVTIFSDCVGNVCGCPVDRYHDDATDKCTLIDCGEVQTIDNGTVTKNGSSYGSNLYITCDHGHELSDNAIVNCSSHGSWGHLPTCEPVRCQEFIKPNYSNVDTNTTGRVFEDRIEITCIEGYALNSSTSSVVCQVDMTWGMSPECLPVTCEQFQKPQNSMISPSKLQYVYNENISIECNEGYQLVGNETLGCQSNGTWIEIPTCEPIDCEPLPFPEFAVIPERQRQYVYNENVTIICKDGYKLDRNESVSCQANSSWTDLPSCIPIECEGFTQPENSETIELNTTRYRYSDFITVTCQSGYTLIGKHNLSCNADGSWSAVYCAKINCTDNLKYPSNSIVMGWNESTSTYEIGCKDGYIIVGNSSVTCLNDATWSTSPTCEARDCGHPSEIPNAGPIDINSTTFNSKFSVECNEGFNSSDLLTVTCQSNGTWSKFPSCNLVSCGNVTVPEYVDITSKEGNTYGKNVTFECIEGYELEGNSKISCQQNGSWTSYPVCQIKDCGQISEISDGIVFSETGTTFGSTVHIKCNEGFDIVGNDIVTCLSTGEWNIFPTCKETDCGNYSPPQHTNVGPNNTLSCDIGYELINSDVLECIDGNWSKVEGCMPVQCGSFPVINNANTSKTEEKNYVFGDTVKVFCYNGFEILGSSEAKCGANKTWENVPNCERIICQEFSVPKHSVIGEQNTKNRVFEDKIFVNCSDGYDLIGNDSTICGANKEWQYIPRCDPIVCEELHIPNSMNQLDIVQYKYNEDVTVTCISGYILEGKETLRCRENGTWIDKPTCNPKRCEPLEIRYAELQPNTSEYVFSEYITVTCNSGYMLKGNNSIGCLENGTWIKIPSCIPVPCEPLIIPNASLEPEKIQYVYNESVRVNCNSGYTIKGKDTFNCLENGSWTNTPSCTPIICDQPTIPNGHIIPNKTEYVYNESVVVKCNTGYMTESNELTLKCLENRNWEDIPTCKPVECPVFPLPNKALILMEKEKYIFNDSVTLTCDTGYYIEGNSSITCQINSSWTALPSCKPIECEDFIQPVNSKEIELNTTGHKYGDPITVTCQSGYTLIGEHNLSCNADGSWPVVNCAKINCTADLVQPKNSIVIAWNESTSTYEIGCKDGYNIVGNSSVTCLNNATWSIAPLCEVRNCGRPSEIPDAAPVYINSTTFNSNFSVECNEGFNSSDPLTVTCQSNGTWSKFPTCNLVSCGNVTVPEFAKITSKEGNTYGKIVIFECIEGYELEGNSEIVCQQNGSWMSYPDCQIKDCGQISEISDGIVFNETGTTFGSTVNIKCNEGFDIVGNDIVTCLSTGEWNIFPTCKETDCGNYSPPQHTNVGPNNTLSCDIGYELINSDVLECIDGNWSKVEGCMPVQCGSFPVINNANTSKTEEKNYVFGATVKVFCYNGFEILGSSEAKCGANKTWENVPNCERIICQEFSVPKHSVIGEQNTKNRVFEDKIFVNCSDGYDLIGNDSTICGANKEWQYIPRCDPIVCEELHIPNSMNQLDIVQYKYNEDVTVTCISGYTLEGNGTLKCLDNGSWTNIPKCKPVFCGQLDIPYASLDPDQTQFRYNDSVSVACNSGYILAGNDTLECLEDGSWTDMPMCEPVFCDQPDIPNASLDPDQTQFRYNDSARVACNSGYTLAGNDTLECLEDGSWTDVPTCNPVPCGQPDIPNASLDPDQTQFRYNDSVSVACNSGYTLAGNDTLECLEDGSWTDVPTCNPVPCGQLDIPNASLDPDQTQFRYNDSVSVACNSGYTLAGNDTLECLEDGSWTDVPTCNPVPCGQPDIPNASLDPDQTQFRYNDSVSVACNSGYTLAGNDTLECLEDGSWTDVPTCNPILCGQLDIPNSSLDPDKTKYEFNETVRVMCNSGYILVGNDTLNCLENGSWINIPSCSLYFCDLPHIQNADVVPVKTYYTFNETVTVECVESFQLEGNRVISCNENGTWINSTMCMPVRCEQPSIQNAGFKPNKTEYTYNENVTVLCDFGYALQGDDIVSCAANRTWANVSICIPVECKLFTLPENAIFLTIQDRYAYNENVTLECRDGYELEGNSTIKCQANTSWTELPICKPIACEPLQLPDYAKTDTNFTVISYEDEISVSCKNGFIPFGFNNLSCYANGTWPDIICVEVNCSTDNILKPENSVNIDINETVPSFEIKCREGYQIVGNSSVSCLDGKWSQIPTCEIVNCGDYIPISDTYLVSSDNITTYNSSLNITCIAGLEFTNDSARVITCGANGQWKGNPVCNITGKVSFTKDDYSLIKGDDESINCDVTDYPGWQNVIVAKLDMIKSNSYTPIVRIFHENGTVVKETLDDNYITETSLKTDGVSVTVMIKKAECGDKGIYICAAIVGNQTDPVEMKQTRTNVSFSCAEGCGEYVPGADISFDLVQSNTTIPINTSVAVKCKDGLDFTNDSTTYLTCDADGQWIGQPKCRIPGIISFTKTAYPFEINDTEMIICEITNYSSWQNVLVAKNANLTDEQLSPIALVTKENDSFPFVNVFDGSYKVNATAREDGVVVSVLTSPVACASEGIYRCAAVVGNEENPVDSIVTETRVTIITESQSPDIRIPPMIYLGRDAHAQCTGSIGKGPTGERKGNLLMMTNFGDNGSIALYNGSDSPSIEGCYYRDTITQLIPTKSSGSYLWAKCIIQHFNGTDIESEQKNISVQDSFVAFEKMSYFFDIGKKVSFVCEVENVLEFYRIEIRSDGRTVAALNTSDMAVETVDSRISILENETLILNSSAKVVVMFDLTECSDTPEDMVGDVEYTCAVLSGSETVEGMTVVTFQNLDSEDLLNGENGEDAQVICNLNNINIDFSNLTDNPVSVETDNSLGLIFESSRDNLSESNTFVTSNGVKVSLGTNSIILKFEPLQCQHVGKYTFRYATLETASQIDIIANVSTPTISNEPKNFYENQQVSLKCTGNVGRPKGDLVLQVKSQNEENWQDIPEVTSKEEETINCTTLMTLNYLFYVERSHDGNQYRCKSEGVKGESLNSSIVVAEVIESVIYFTEAVVAAEIGSDFELKCILEGNLANNHVVISRKTVNNEENICTMTNIDTVVCSPANIGGNATFSEGNRVITVNIDAAECGDEGTYFCGSVNDTSFKTSINVSLTRSPAWNPMLSLPNRMVVDFKEPSLNISCRADVGYPPGDLRLEYSRDSSTSFSTFDIGTAGTPVETKEGCSVNKSISYKSYTYTESWNNTRVRCAVYSPTNTSEEPVVVSDIQTVNLIVNECPSSGFFVMNHPLNCHFYISCNSDSPIDVDSCGNRCPDIVNNTTTPHCFGNCTELCML